MSKSAQRCCQAYGIIVICIAFIADFYSSIIVAMVAAVLLALYGFLLVLSLSRMELRTILIAISAACVIVSLVTDHWALKLRFSLSRNSLQAAVNHSLHEPIPPASGQYGFFRLKRICTHRTGPSMAVSLDESWNPGNFSGVVYSTGRIPSSLNSKGVIELDEKWYYVHGD